jgi:uncharacterized membrane protein (DUF485 family)
MTETQAMNEMTPEELDAHKAHTLVQSSAFKKLVRDRWTVSLVLLGILFVIYYGYILLLGYAKDFVNTKIGEFTTLAIPIGVAVIIGAWVLTLIYVWWANSVYDKEVERLKQQL